MKEHRPVSKLKGMIKYLILALTVAINPFMGGYFIGQEMSKLMRLALMIFISFLLALGFSSKGVYDFLKSRPLELQGQSIIATIVDVKYVGVKHQAPYITYEFTAKNGDLMRGAGIDRPPIRPDHKVEVIYLSDNPSHNLLRADLERRIKGRSFFKFMSFIFIALTGFFFGIYRYYRQSIHKK
jgi:hypothetical protein